ncbi:MAG: 3-deoxy-D-manno-octulosonic acid kinase [Xanthomonadales bacterium]
MKPRTHKQDSRIIVYDADLIQQPGAHLFAADAWERSGSIAGQAPGRGSALFLETDFGPAVLRHYLRGGWAAHLSRDHYLYTGPERSRPIAEFHMLARLYKKGLPVPRPLAAQCVRKGLFYSGDLMTRRLLDVIPLADLPDLQQTDPAMWITAGACIRNFHDHGLVHADLNARNILVGSESSVYLIDFDRAQIRQGARNLFEANLRRLKRSLQKILGPGQLERGWQYLQRGYNEGPSGQSSAGPQGCGKHHPGPFQ